MTSGIPQSPVYIIEFSHTHLYGKATDGLTHMSKRTKTDKWCDLSFSPPVPVCDIYERDRKKFATPAVKQEWEARIRLIEKALNTPQIFSFSIIPADLFRSQTWYHQKAYLSTIVPPEKLKNLAFIFHFPEEEVTLSDSSIEASPAIPAGSAPSVQVFMLDATNPFSPTSEFLTEERIKKTLGFTELHKLECDLLSSEPNQSRYGPKGDFKESRSHFEQSDQPDASPSSATTFPGFFQPFSNFSSILGKPEYTSPEQLSSVSTINTSMTQEIESLLEELEDEAIRNNIRAIVQAFQQDVHSLGLGLTLLEPSRNRERTVLFKKNELPLVPIEKAMSSIA